MDVYTYDTCAFFSYEDSEYLKEILITTNAFS